MTKESALQVMEWMALVEERGAVYEGMMFVCHAESHLRKLPPSEENLAAIATVGPLACSLENENKALSEKECELWDAVLRANERELSSKELACEEWTVYQGQDWIRRITRRLGKEHGEHDDRDAPIRGALTTLSDLSTTLARRRTELSNAQRDHQMARAKYLALQVMGHVN